MPSRNGPVRSARIRRLGIQSIVIEGDSITELVPYTYEASKYSWQYALSRPDKTWHITAHLSRQVGALADLNSGQNELIGHVGEDNSYAPQLITAMMGANDLPLAPDTTIYRQNLINYKKQLNALGIKFVWSGPISYNPTGTTHPNYANFMALRANIFSNARDPNVWGQYADYYMPMGEIPDFNDTAAASLFSGDPVHPNAAGQQLLLNCYKAVMDTILTPGLEFSKQPDPGIWPKSQTNLAVSTTYVDRFVVKGIAHKGLASGISINPGTSGAQIRLNGTDNPSYAGFGGSYGTSFGPIYNGDVIDVKYATSASNDTPISFDLTIGAETRTITKRTVIAVTPAAYVHGDIQGRNSTGTTFTTTPVAFSVGKAVIFANAGGPSTATSITINGAGPGGTNISAVLQFQQTGNGRMEVWTADLPTAGSYTVTAVYPSQSIYVMSMGTVTNADPTPVTIVGSATASESDPHLLPSVTIPASGILLAAFGEYYTTSVIPPATANNGTLVAEGSVTNSSQVVTRGIALSKNTTAGAVQASFNDGFGTYGRAAILFKALGT